MAKSQPPMIRFLMGVMGDEAMDFYRKHASFLLYNSVFGIAGKFSRKIECLASCYNRGGCLW